jgi:UDP-N-acetylmuramoyl-tripeptide--D-alanyl-D-alanine ligase
MLQSSEYKIDDYLKWLDRTDDFRLVIRRRKLDYTKKAVLLLTFVWLVLIIIYLIVVYLLIQSVLSTDYLMAILSIIIFAISPLVIAYGIVIPLWLGKLLIQNPKQRKLISSAKQIFANHSAVKIAIAGSFGKTTAKEIISTILSQGKKVAFTPGNMNTAIGISRFAQTLDGNEDIIVFELGEEKVGDVRDLCKLTGPDIGIITGINEAHLSSFGTLDNTIATIFEIKGYLGDKTLYKNIESSLVATNINDDDKFAYSHTGTNGWQVSKIKTNINGTEFVVQKSSKTLFCSTNLLGTHNVGIIAVAIDIADKLGITIPQIITGIKNTKSFEHRMQPKQLHGAWVIDDTYNGNSEGVKAGLMLLKSLDAKRRIYVTPGLVEQGDKNREIHEQIGQQIAKVADVVVLMQNSVTEFICSGLQIEKFKGQLIIVDDPLEFYTNLEYFVVKGDVVLMQNDWTDNYA